MEIRISFVNSDSTGLPFSAIFSFVTLSKDNVNMVYRFGLPVSVRTACCFSEDVFVMAWKSQPF